MTEAVGLANLSSNHTPTLTDIDTRFPSAAGNSLTHTCSHLHPVEYECYLDWQ